MHIKLQSGVSVENAVIRDAFARSILMFRSPDVKLSGISVERSPGEDSWIVGQVQAWDWAGLGPVQSKQLNEGKKKFK